VENSSGRSPGSSESSKPLPSTPVISLPKGGGAIRGISEKFNVNAVNGTANLSLTLPLSDSRASFTPDLHLAYDSGSGNGPFGMGWKLDVPAVTRRTDKGLPRYFDGLESDTFVLSGAEDLVPLLDTSGNRVQSSRTVHGVAYDIFPYMPRIEGLYAKIERWVATATGRTHWRIITSDNVTSLFGFDDDSLVTAGITPEKTFSYLLCRRFDDKGNLILYSYADESDENLDLSVTHEANRLPEDRTRQRYLKSVRYGFTAPYFQDWSVAGPEPPLPPDWHFELVLDYGEHDATVPKTGDHGPRSVRPDPFSDYRPGYEVRTYRRCLRVLMFHHFPDEPDVGRDCLVHALDLKYDDQGTPPDPNAPVYSFITSATQSGFRRNGAGYLSKALPPVEFEYSKPVIDRTIRTLPPECFANLPEGVDGTRFRFVDLEAEGMPGILSDDGTAWHYQRNLSPLSGVPLPGGTEPRETANFEAANIVTDLPSGHALAGEVQLLDIRGEGRVDVVSFQQNAPGFWTREPEIGWDSFVAFRSQITADINSANMRFVDLTGDGRPDVLIGEDNLWMMYPSLGELGYGAAELVRAAWDESSGGPPVYSNDTESIHLADMSGDGLADLVRIRNGETSFWPNLGYGRFGRKVTMEGSPHFATPDQFDPHRVHLVDIDGSGTSDILYVGSDGVSVWFNRSGNTWSAPQRIAVFPTADLLSSVQTADLLGNGTACLVWSSPLPAQGVPLRYVDLMSGQKPHLLIRSRNNLGAETHLTYAPSTRFYLEDRLTGIPWITRLPFPVQVIERVELYDFIGRSRFVTRYAYHHGNYDGEEREFRGFGMVETWDTETYRADDTFPNVENWDADSLSPPVYTKTWFHTGTFLEEGLISKQFALEYWIEPALEPDARATDRAAMELPDSIIPAGLAGDEAREACRALKSHTLRVETYSEDGTALTPFPYTVTEYNYQVRMVQPIAGNRYGVFSSCSSETLTLHYERAGADPRVSHSVIIEVDDYDQPLRSVSITYPRRPGYPAPEPGFPASIQDPLSYDQERQHVLGIQHAYTNTVLADDRHRIPRPCEIIQAELNGFTPASTRPGVTNLFRLSELDSIWATIWNPVHDIPHEQVASPDVDGTGALPAGLARRILKRARSVFRKDDLTSLLPLGEIESLAFPGNTYHLALTPGLLARVLDGKVGAPELTEGGYVQLPGSDGWWIPGDLMRFSSGDGDTAAVELAYAQQHFFIERRSINPFGAVNRTLLDKYDLLPVLAVDPLGNQHAATIDYRVLEPSQITDPNGNRAEVSFDVLGLVAGSAVRGKVTESIGDSLVGFNPDLDDPTIAAHLANPLADPLSVLGQASARIIYDVNAYMRTRGNPQPDAAVSYLLERETHVSDLAPGQTSRYRHTLNYSDGFGRQVQKKIQAEPGPLVGGGPSVSPRWVGSGWTVYDNKGQAVRRYEPFFTATSSFEFNQQVGVSRYTCYDPLGRVVATLQPNNTWHKTNYEAWRTEIWDANDTVLIPDPRGDADVGNYFRRLLGMGAFTSWYDARIGGTFGTDATDMEAERDAAQKAALNAATPGIDHFDSAGHTCLSVMDLGINGRRPTRTVHDIEGSQLTTIDPLGRGAIEYVVREPQGSGFQYVDGRDLAGRELFHNTMDGGARRELPDIFGNPIRSWDARSHAVRLRYDLNRRPTHRYVATSGGPEHLVSRTIYGEGMPQTNLCAQIFRHYDQSGLSSNESCDFKGNLLDRARQLAREYRTEVDWSPLGDETDPANLDLLAAPLLVTEDRFVARAFHDAFNRPVQAVTPHNAAMKPNVVLATYNEGGKVQAVDVWEQQPAVPTGLLDPTTADIHAVTDSKYDANGQRTSITRGNGTVTAHTIDPLTKRLVRILTTRPSSFPGNERVVQDLRYTHDPSGNITRTRDVADIQDVVFFRNRRVDPSSDFTYDAGYRLLRATGREHLGQTGGALSAPMQPTGDDSFRANLLQPGDGNAMGTYVEQYNYDPVGNLLVMIHQVASGSWRRSYAYAEASRIDAAQFGNRLSATSLPGDPASGPYSAKYTYDAHGNATGMPHLSSIAWNERDSLSSTSTQVVTSGTPETTFYTYDGADQRLRKITDRASAGAGSRRKERIYLGAIELYREYGVDGTTVILSRETLTIVSDRKLVAVLETRTSGTDPAARRALKYQFANLVGSSTLELDEASQVISYEEYFPYGGTSYSAVQNQTETPRRARFCGKQRDEENGFYYFGLRYYAPWLGRWFNPDPEGLADGPNVYLYAHANPVNVIDPDGTVGLILGLGAGELGFLFFGSAVVAVGVSQTAARHPPRLPDWHPFSTGDDDTYPSPPWTPPVPKPVPAPPPVAPPVPTPVPAPPVPAPPVPIPAPPVPVPVPVPVPIPGPLPIPVPIPLPVPRPIPIPIPIPLPGPPAPSPNKNPKRKTDPKPKTGPGDDPHPVPKDKPRKDKKDQTYRYVTYTKSRTVNGRTFVYSGHTSGYGTPQQIVARRDIGHDMTAKGYGPAAVESEVPATLPPELFEADPSYWAMRGREQQVIDFYGGAQRDPNRKPNSLSGNDIRAVSKRNKWGKRYHDASDATFGPYAPYTGK
jgi:RHS repeat-associated protein